MTTRDYCQDKNKPEQNKIEQIAMMGVVVVGEKRRRVRLQARRDKTDRLRERRKIGGRGAAVGTLPYLQ